MTSRSTRAHWRRPHLKAALVPLVLLLAAADAWADHGGTLRSAGFSPLMAALIFGGLALLAGMLVIVIVALLSRRRS
jgi:hypothetical protein